MGCYGIGVGRILIAAVESCTMTRESSGRRPSRPFSVVITPIKYDGEVKEAADKLYAQLNAAGIDTLLDDRDARPGFKFADADLIGFPVRITVGDRGLKEGKVELKRTKGGGAGDGGGGCVHRARAGGVEIVGMQHLIETSFDSLFPVYRLAITHIYAGRNQTKRK